MTALCGPRGAYGVSELVPDEKPTTTVPARVTKSHEETAETGQTKGRSQSLRDRLQLRGWPRGFRMGWESRKGARVCRERSTTCLLSRSPRALLLWLVGLLVTVSSLLRNFFHLSPQTCKDALGEPFHVRVLTSSYPWFRRIVKSWRLINQSSLLF